MLNRNNCVKRDAATAMKEIIVILALFILNSCSFQQEEQLRVGTNIWPGYETLYLARDKGFLPENVKLIELLSATDTMEAFRNKRIEVAALTLDEALSLEGEGIDVKIFLVMDMSHGSDTLLVRNGINSVTDLKGKTVAYEQTALGALMMHEILSLANLTVNDITTIHLHINEHYKAFITGGIDAVITFEPVSTQLMNQGFRPVFDSSQIPGRIVDVLVIREEDIHQYDKTIQALVDGQFKALDFLTQSPEEATQIMAKRMGITAEELANALKGIRVPDRKKNWEMLSGMNDEHSLKDTLVTLNQILYETDIVDKKLALDDVFDACFVE